jgi:hypothetical protein
MKKELVKAYNMVIKNLQKRSVYSCPKCDHHDYPQIALLLQEILEDSK